MGARMMNFFHRFSDFINTALFIALLILAGETLCVRSALTEDGIVIGHPKLRVEYLNTPAQITSGAAATQSAPLLQLAAFDAASDARRQRKQRSR
jgi:hypothetical protein